MPFGLTGGLYDPDTKLIHFGYREYYPEVGRWITKDPVGFDDRDSNLYGYVLNNPVNLVDPWGYNALVTVSGGVLVVPIPGAKIICGILIEGAAIWNMDRI